MNRIREGMRHMSHKSHMHEGMGQRMWLDPDCVQ
jgi:hypothetical protein